MPRTKLSSTDEEAKRLMLMRMEVLEKKIVRAKGMLRCASNRLLPGGVFGACGGCDNSTLCRNIQRMIEADISKAYDSVRQLQGGK